MPVLSLRLTSEQDRELKEKAALAEVTPGEYAKALLFPGAPKSSTLLSMSTVLNRIKQRKSQGDIFTIPDLFSSSEWSNFTNTVTIGRKFRIASKDPTSAVSQVVAFVEKRSGHSAVYQKL